MQSWGKATGIKKKACFKSDWSKGACSSTYAYDAFSAFVAFSVSISTCNSNKPAWFCLFLMTGNKLEPLKSHNALSVNIVIHYVNCIRYIIVWNLKHKLQKKKKDLQVIITLGSHSTAKCVLISIYCLYVITWGISQCDCQMNIFQYCSADLLLSEFCV